MLRSSPVTATGSLPICTGFPIRLLLKVYQADFFKAPEQSGLGLTELLAYVNLNFEG